MKSYTELNRTFFVLKSVSAGHDFYLRELAFYASRGYISRGQQDIALAQHRAVKAHKAFMAELEQLTHELQSEDDDREPQGI